MTDEIKKFIIEDRKTPYSEIKDIKVEGDLIFYTEKFDLKHPDCPIVHIEINEDYRDSFSQVKKLPKEYFEILYGGLEEKQNSDIRTRTFNGKTRILGESK